MARTRWSIILVAFALTGATAPAALAGAPGTWTQVTGLGVGAANTDEIGLARTADGVLHVAWTRAPSGVYNDELLHSAIGADGKGVTGPDTILGGLELNSSVDLLTAPDGGLRVFFAGLNPASPLDTLLATATAGADGKAWAVQPTPASASTPGQNHPVYVASGIGAGLGPGGAPIGAWGDSSPSGGGYHIGLDPLTPDVEFPAACCDLRPDVAIGADGELVLARVALYDTTSVIARRLATGQELTAPSSAAAQISDRVSLSGRSAGQPGVYLAYTSGANQFSGLPTIWRVGDAKARRLSGRRGAEHTGLSAAPGGAMWVFWERDERLYARRSNDALTRFGATVRVRPPQGTDTVYRLGGEGSRGPLDLLVLIDRGGSLAYWHRRVLPGLSLAAKPKKVAAGGSIKFKVTDAGTGVAGAKVKLKLPGEDPQGKTGPKGTVKLQVPKGSKPGKRTATATKPGYTAAGTRVRVK